MRFRIAVHQRLACRLLLALEIAAFLALSVRIGRNCLASWAADGTSAEELTRAVQLDPGNAEYHLRLARLALYSVAEADPELAREHLLRASGLSPRNVQVWLELSAAFGFQGDNEKAELFLRRADRMAPRIPAVQWVVGNFYLLQGNNNDAFKHFRVTLDGTRRYDRILFRTAWKASEDGAKILTELIPPQINTEFAYLYYLLNENKPTEARAVWKRIAASPEKFDAGRAAGFVDWLLNARMPDDAGQVWSDLINKGLIPPTYKPTAQNLITNGNFEDDLLGAGFDWRIAKAESVEVYVDGSTSHSPSHSVRVKFSGKVNASFDRVYQHVRVEPSQKYRFQAYLKTEGITTDSGLRLRVLDYYAPTQLLEFSENFTGTTPTWSQVWLEFKTGPTTQLVLVSLVRSPSRKLDNLIAGTAWLDDVSLTPIP